MKKILYATVFLAAMAAVAACNTMRGLGQDIEKGGQAIEKAATK